MEWFGLNGLLLQVCYIDIAAIHVVIQTVRKTLAVVICLLFFVFVLLDFADNTLALTWNDCWNYSTGCCHCVFDTTRQHITAASGQRHFIFMSHFSGQSN